MDIRTDRRVEVIIMLSQLLVVAVAESVAELGNKEASLCISTNNTL